MKLEKKHWILIGLGLAAVTGGIIIYKKRQTLKAKALQEVEARDAVAPQTLKSARTQEVSEPIVQIAHFPLKRF